MDMIQINFCFAFYLNEKKYLLKFKQNWLLISSNKNANTAITHTSQDYTEQGEKEKSFKL